MSNATTTSTASEGPVPVTAEARAQQKKQTMRALVRTIGMLPVLIVLCLLIWGLEYSLSGESRFVSARNLSTVLQQTSLNVVLAAGMTFVILTGGIDLSVGSILAASAVTGLIASLHVGAAWIVVSMLIGVVIGLGNGALIAFLRLPPFIVTLGSLTAVRGLARLLGNDETVMNDDLPLSGLGDQALFGVPWLVIIAAVVIVVSWLILRRTVLGVHIYAVGGNEAAAGLSGIKVKRVLLFVYGASGLLAGVGGIMQAARLSNANGSQLGLSYELDAIAAVIVGGTSFVGGIGSIWGTVIGALIIAVLNNGLVILGVPDMWQYIIKGGVIIGAVTLDRVRLRGSART